MIGRSWCLRILTSLLGWWIRRLRVRRWCTSSRSWMWMMMARYQLGSCRCRCYATTSPSTPPSPLPPPPQPLTPYSRPHACPSPSTVSHASPNNSSSKSVDHSSNSTRSSTTRNSLSTRRSNLTTRTSPIAWSWTSSRRYWPSWITRLRRRRWGWYSSMWIRMRWVRLGLMSSMHTIVGLMVCRRWLTCHPSTTMRKEKLTIDRVVMGTHIMGWLSISRMLADDY